MGGALVEGGGRGDHSRRWQGSLPLLEKAPRSTPFLEAPHTILGPRGGMETDFLLIFIFASSFLVVGHYRFPLSDQTERAPGIAEASVCAGLQAPVLLDSSITWVLPARPALSNASEKRIADSPGEPVPETSYVQVRRERTTFQKPDNAEFLNLKNRLLLAPVRPTDAPTRRDGSHVSGTHARTPVFSHLPRLSCREESRLSQLCCTR